MGQHVASASGTKSRGKKRKREGRRAEQLKSLEIDINAPEPASRKTLRRSKRLNANAARGGPSLGNDTTDREVLQPIPKELSKPKSALSRSPHGIWIGNLPFHVTKDDLQSFITGDKDDAIPADQIRRIHLPPGQATPGIRFQNKGFAYIDFSSADIVEKALRLSEKLVGGRRVLIKSSSDFQGRPQTATASRSSRPPNKRIFVGNLGFNTSKADLENHFQLCGPIHDVHMASFEDSGKCKGYAWIEFEQLSSAESAVRGWVETQDVLSDAKAETSFDHERVRKRTWINRMEDRKLRMEFAEDKATRYQKRFGKESHTKGEERISSGGTATDPSTGQGEVEESHHRGQAGPSPRKLQKVDYSHQPRSGYSLSSIQKMTGAIADGQGTKITFD